MKILVCGDRNWNDYNYISRILDPYKNKIECLIEGGARGVDSLAAQWAIKNNIKLIEVKAEWDKYKKAAGPIRNREMLKYRPDLVIAFHDNIEKSKGTKDMLNVSKDVANTLLYSRTENERTHARTEDC
jgi:hypothetical protein